MERSQKNYADAEGLLYRQNCKLLGLIVHLHINQFAPKKYVTNLKLVFKRKLIYIRLVAPWSRIQATALMHMDLYSCKDTMIIPYQDTLSKKKGCSSSKCDSESYLHPMHRLSASETRRRL